MTSQREYGVLTRIPGFYHTPLDLSTLANSQEDKAAALAVTMPFRNAIACIDVGFRSKAGWPYPWEESLHHISVLSSVSGLYAIVREDTKKVIENDSSDHYQSIDKMAPLVEGIADTVEEFSPYYHSVMEDYRQKVLEYFHTDDRTVFSRGGPMEQKVRQEKILMREAAANLIRTYKGTQFQGIGEPLTALAIYTASMYPKHRNFLRKCATLNKPWKSLLSMENLYDALDGDVHHFPLDQFHVAIMQSTDLVSDIVEYYSTLYAKAKFLTASLPSMVGAIDFSTGMFDYFNFVLTFMRYKGKPAFLPEVVPRVTNTVADYRYMRLMVEGTKNNCLLARSFRWPANPDKPLDETISSLGTTFQSQVVGYWLDRYTVLMDLMEAFEETVVQGKLGCPWCKSAVLNLRRLNPELEDQLRNRCISRNSHIILPLLNNAAANIPSMLHSELRRICVQYATILTS